MLSRAVRLPLSDTSIRSRMPTTFAMTRRAGSSTGLHQCASGTRG
jgi:hypothetical protein